MLTERERHGISELLLRMDVSDLRSLAQTVTSRLIVPETRNEAIESIILHTDTPFDLLKRRKVKRDFMFKYLHAKRVPIESTAEKSVIIRQVIALWGGNGDEVVVVPSSVLPQEEDSLPEAPAPSRNASFTSLCSIDDSFNFVEHSKMDEGNSTSSHDTDGFNNNFVIENNHVTPSQAQEMANKFANWFYDMLNLNRDDFGPHHFWVDASAQIELRESSSMSNAPSDQEFFSVQENGAQVCITLRQIVTKYGLKFNPNNSPEGVRGDIDPHGLVVVTACGTLHNSTTCCGIFHQRFGLIRDPNCGNSWKIKFTEASLISKTVNELPRLTHPELSAMARS